jgi:hypothetical protein
MQILASPHPMSHDGPHLPSSNLKFNKLNCQGGLASSDRPMEDDDSDAEMADYGTDFSDDVDPNVTRESGIGPGSIPRFPGFGGDFRASSPDSRFPSGWESGGPGIGVPGAARRGFPGLPAAVASR